ncbi:sulfurtransferase TusA family protein [Clostridiaceae bacterium 35-E11]
MSKVQVDARGRSCPEPVMMTKTAIDQYTKEEIEVMVDSRVALENVSRLAKNNGYKVEVKENNDEFYIFLKK